MSAQTHGPSFEDELRSVVMVCVVSRAPCRRLVNVVFDMSGGVPAVRPKANARGRVRIHQDKCACATVSGQTKTTGSRAKLVTNRRDGALLAGKIRWRRLEEGWFYVAGSS